jgi:hypothetical protein
MCLRSVKLAGPFALGSGSRLTAARVELLLKLAKRLPDEPRRREARLCLQAAAAFLGFEIYASVKVDTGLRGSGHMMRLPMDASMLPTFEPKARSKS